jgi:phosphatidylinositol-3-phosphatase
MKYLSISIFAIFAMSTLASADTVTVSSPTNNSTVGTSVKYVAKATTSCSKGIAAIGIYTAPNVLAYKVSGASLSTTLTLKTGTYSTVVQDWDNCGGYGKTAVNITVSSSTVTTMPRTSHVFIVVEENHSYSQVIGNRSMPYLNYLASKYGLATKYYANTHPSIGNYFMLTTGQIITNNDGFCSTLKQDNVVRHLLTAGKTWKSYAEGLPSVGYLGCSNSTTYYVKRHNPLAYFSDVANSSSERLNLVPFTHFATDLKNNTLPNYSFIVPNLLDDGHDGSLGTADAWLKKNIAPLFTNAAFLNGGILVIVFDESVDSDTTEGGGHVAAVVIGPKVKPGYKSTTNYQHQNTLKSLMEALGVTSFPASAASAADMKEFF